MKKQRLSALDINILAKELDELIKDGAVDSISLLGQRLKISTDKVDLAFVINSGNPYIVFDKNTTGGAVRFRNLIGGKIEKVRQVNWDRIICLECIAFTKLGLRKKHNLYFELYGNGNVILTDEANVIREIYRGAANRQIGKEYQLPASSTRNLFQTIGDNDIPADLLGQVEKLNIFPHNIIGDDEAAVAKQIYKVINHPQPYLLHDLNGNPCGFSIAGPPFAENISGHREESLIAAITDYVEFISRSEKASGSAGDPQAALKKAQAKLKAIQNELVQTERASLYRQYGEIILANLGIIKKGTKNLRCANPYSQTDEFIEIPLTQSLSPEKNAADYFDKARKLELSVEILKKRLSNQKSKIEELTKRLDTPPSSGQSEDIKKPIHEKTAIKLPFRQIELPDGWRVYVGKSAESNDELTFSFAKKGDIWFHAWQAAGSHVVLRRPNKGDIIPREYLIRAAEIAAFNSKAKTSGKVPVIYTEIRYVRKVRGAAGKVTVTNEKQLMVKPIPPEKSIDY